MDSVFIVKKILGALAMPMPFVVGILLLGLLLALTSKSVRSSLPWAAALGVLLMAVLSLAPLNYLWFSEYERQHSMLDSDHIESLGAGTVSEGCSLPDKFENRVDNVSTEMPAAANDCSTGHAKVQWIVVLGGGVFEQEKKADAMLHASALSRLGASSLARLVEGVRLARLLPDAHLLLSGSGVFVEDSNAHVYYLAAQELGLAAQRMTKVESPVDTQSEAVEIRRLLGDAPFLLVTSASHMPRAMRLMAMAGLNPIAAPAHFTFHKSPDHFLSWLPDERNLASFRTYWHEQVGMRFMDIKSLVGLGDETRFTQDE